jgi:hypothetical protein
MGADTGTKPPEKPAAPAMHVWGGRTEYEEACNQPTHPSQEITSTEAWTHERIRLGENQITLKVVLQVYSTNSQEGRWKGLRGNIYRGFSNLFR